MASSPRPRYSPSLVGDCTDPRSWVTERDLRFRLHWDLGQLERVGYIAVQSDGLNQYGYVVLVSLRPCSCVRPQYLTHLRTSLLKIGRHCSKFFSHAEGTPQP